MEKMTRNYCCREVGTFTAMVMVECGNVGLSILFKAAANAGVSYRIFLVYSYVISAVVLTPLAVFFHRNTQLPRFSISLLGRILILSILGFSAQMLGYKGIEYSSPTMSSAMSNLTPAFTFAFALLLRMEKLQLRSTRSQAKVLGTIISITGALVVVLYEGPVVIRTPIPSDTTLDHPLPIITSSKSDWILGGLLLAADYIILSMWYIVQAQTVMIYPAEFLIVLLFNVGVAIISAPICFLIEPNRNAWRITTGIMLVAVIYSGVVGSSLGNVVHTWGLRVKGPVYVALFRPLSIAIAAIMGFLFLGEALYLGSVIGALIISIGFYVVMWGKATEETSNENLESLSAENVSLLH